MDNYTNQIKSKPIPERILKQLRNDIYNPYIELTLNTGARLNELLFIVNNYDYDVMPDTIEAPVKKQKHKGVFYINKDAKKALDRIGIRLRKNSISRSTLVRRINGTLKLYGNYTNHNLRSYYCTSLMSKGINLKTISILMHHRQLSQTAQYLFCNEKMLMSASNSLCDDFTYDGLSNAELIKELYRLRRIVNEKGEK